MSKPTWKCRLALCSLVCACLASVGAEDEAGDLSAANFKHRLLPVLIARDMARDAGDRYPGEFGIDKETYLRWFGYISDMNVQVIRVYVNQTPEFYQALMEFNRKAERPLWLLHGVYANEDLIADCEGRHGQGLRDVCNRGPERQAAGMWRPQD